MLNTRKKERSSQRKKKHFYVFLILTVFLGLLLIAYESAFIWAIFTASVLFTINLIYKFKSKSRKNLLDLGTIAIMVLTLVMIHISVPILHPRIEVTNIGDPRYLILDDDSGKAYRTFTFQITNPIIPSNLGKSIRLGNKIYYVHNLEDTYGVSSSNVEWHLNGDSNSLTFHNLNNRGFDKEIISLEIQTDFPISYEATSTNITNLYKFDDQTFCSAYPVSIINYEKQAVTFRKNLTIVIPNNANMFIPNNLNGQIISFEDYRKSKSKDGCFWLVDNCNWSTSNYAVGWSDIRKKNGGLEITFTNLGEIEPLPDYKNFKVSYFPFCGKNSS